jgi:hypothetical protein
MRMSGGGGKSGNNDCGDDYVVGDRGGVDVGGKMEGRGTTVRAEPSYPKSGNSVYRVDLTRNASNPQWNMFVCKQARKIKTSRT